MSANMEFKSDYFITLQTCDKFSNLEYCKQVDFFPTTYL